MKGKISAALIAVLLALGTLGLSISSIGTACEYALLDQWFRIGGTLTPPSDTVIVALDEQSYNDLKLSPNQAWPRTLHAELLEKLKQYGAKRAVFDVLFLGPGSDPDADARLAAAIAGIPTILGVDSSVQQMGGPGGRYSLEELLEPYEPFLKAAAGVGLVGLPDSGGAVRNFLITRTERTRTIPSLAEAAAGLTAPAEAAGPAPQDLIRYYGPARSIPTYSAYQLLSHEKDLPAQLFKDKVILIGLVLRSEVGPAQKDAFQTPFGGGAVFGAEIHATAADNLMQRRWVKRAAPLTEHIGVFLFALVAGFILLTVTPVWGVLIAAIVAVVWAASSFYLFAGGFFLPGVIPVIFFLPVTLLGSTLYYYLVVRRSARQMRSAFELYLSPEMARDLGSSNSAAQLGGEKLWCTALFTDIWGFTALTEEMPAEKVAEMLNAYFTEVMEVVFQNKGTLIKFIGDAVFVLWGAPVKVPNHAELAIKTGLSISREVENFNRTGRFPALRTRVGIHTGPMVVGNLGSKKRFDYTAIGDSVNLASRVEGLNKYLGTSILFTGSAKKDAGNSVYAVRVGAVRVSGKREVVDLYTSFASRLAPELEKDWDETLALFERREFEKARERFENFAKFPELAALASFYVEQCRASIATPPPERWSGELLFKSK